VLFRFVCVCVLGEGSLGEGEGEGRRSGQRVMISGDACINPTLSMVLWSASNLHHSI